MTRKTAFRRVGAVIVTVAAVLGLLALAVPPLRNQYVGLADVLVALAYWAVQFVVILRVWGSRRLFQMRGPASGYRTVRKYTSSLSGRPLAVSVAVFLAAVLNIVLSVTFGSEPGLRANAWGGYGMAIWITGMGIIWDAALLRQPAKLN